MRREIILSVIVISIAVSTSSAYDWATNPGDGTEANPYQISTAEQMNAIGADVTLWDKYFILTADIDLSGYPFGIKQIGNSTTKFTGIFDGDWHTMDNFTCIHSGDYFGLFRLVGPGGEIKDLTLTNVAIDEAEDNSGALVGQNEGSVTNCYSTGTLVADNYIGGLVGYNLGSITNCYSTGSVTGSWYAGGLVGKNSGSITNSYSTGSVNGRYGVGGLVGTNGGDIDNSYSTSSVTGGECVGGLVGFNAYHSSLTKSYSTGHVIGTGENVGGLAGENWVGIISHSYSNSDVDGTDENVGGLVGKNDGNITSSHSSGVVNGTRNNVGGLVGRNGDNITNSYSSATVTGTYSCIGGLAGYNNGKITNSYSSGNIEGKSKVGGLAGENRGNITNSHSNSAVYGTGDYVGGLAGYNSYNITNSYSTGLVTGNDYVGGLVGENSSSVSNSYSTGSVNGVEYVGGLLGKSSDGAIVINCYSTGLVDGYWYVGGLAGYNNSSIANTYSVGTAVGTNHVGALIGHNYPEGIVTRSYFLNTAGPDNGVGTSLTDSAMRQKGSFAGWDFVVETADGTSQVWQMASGGGYPVLSSFNGYTPAVLGGSGTEASPYLINDSNELGAIYYYSNSFFSLECDIDLAGILWSTAVIPVFGSSFEGNGHVIRNLTIDGGGHLGLFGKIYNSTAKVKNLGIINCNITGAAYVGGLVGHNRGNITNSHSTGSVSGGSCAGGLIGKNYYGKIKTCYSICSVNSTNNYAGGLIGDNTGDIINCYSTGSVHSTNNCVGGLVGKNQDHAEITECYATGEVIGNNYVAGLAGSNDFRITASYATGAIRGNGDYVGGLVGYNHDTIRKSYATGSVTGNDTVGGLVGINYRVIIESYATGSVTGNLEVGGLLGINNHTASLIRACYAMGPVNGDKYVGGLIGKCNSGKIKNTYATGFVTCTNRYGGGFMGANSFGEISASFWDIQTSGMVDGIGNRDPDSAGVTGKTTDEMQTQITFTDAGWDFQNLWWIDEGNDYPRLWWEFTNSPPVANAGEDQVVYAGMDGLTQVTLDGTGSYDPDGDPLEYFWYNDANDLIATGAEPNVILPVGEHVIDLIVSDGILDSEPNDVMITVIAPAEAEMMFVPQALNPNNQGNYVTAIVTLPDGVEVDDLDENELWRLVPGDIEALFSRTISNKKRQKVFAAFNRQAVIDALETTVSPEQNGEWKARFANPNEQNKSSEQLRHRNRITSTAAEITVFSKLKTGQTIGGRDVIRIIQKIHSAIQHEDQAGDDVQKSMERIGDVYDVLGIE